MTSRWHRMTPRQKLAPPAGGAFFCVLYCPHATPHQQGHPAQARQPHESRWRVVLMRSKGELLGYVDATDAQGAEAVAAEQFRLDRWQRGRLLAWGTRLSDDR